MALGNGNRFDPKMGALNPKGPAFGIGDDIRGGIVNALGGEVRSKEDILSDYEVQREITRIVTGLKGVFPLSLDLFSEDFLETNGLLYQTRDSIIGLFREIISLGQDDKYISGEGSLPRGYEKTKNDSENLLRSFLSFLQKYQFELRGILKRAPDKLSSDRDLSENIDLKNKIAEFEGGTRYFQLQCISIKRNFRDMLPNKKES